ncbi:MAG TPA: hypothetical protein VF417_06695, partial [Candidatus Methylomirabilis sp.]
RPRGIVVVVVVLLGGNLVPPKGPESSLWQHPRLAVTLAAAMKRARRGGRAPGTRIGSERGSANSALRREPERAI